LDRHDEETNDSGFEFDEHNGEGAGHDVNRFEIHTDSDLHVWGRIESKEDEIAIRQRKF
jgi:hypothetical protein